MEVIKTALNNLASDAVAQKGPRGVGETQVSTLLPKCVVHFVCNSQPPQYVPTLLVVALRCAQNVMARYT